MFQEEGCPRRRESDCEFFAGKFARTRNEPRRNLKITLDTCTFAAPASFPEYRGVRARQSRKIGKNPLNVKFNFYRGIEKDNDHAHLEGNKHGGRRRGDRGWGREKKPARDKREPFPVSRSLRSILRSPFNLFLSRGIAPIIVLIEFRECGYFRRGSGAREGAEKTASRRRR